MTYIVQAGDTLSAVARAFGITLSDLLTLNPQYRGRENLLRVGAKLNVPEAESGEGDTNPEAASDDTEFLSDSEGKDGEDEQEPEEEQAAETQSESESDFTLPYHRRLGMLSTRYETGGRGSSVVSGGQGDPGGVSYGTYQMNSKPNGGTVLRFITAEDFPWSEAFDQLVPGTPAFTAQWKALVAQNRVAFADAEHAFIDRTHFRLLCANVLQGCGVDITTRSNALQNVVWSVAVQHGAGTTLINRAVNAVFTAEGEECNSDKHLINAIYDERSRAGTNGALAYFSKCSPQVQEGVRRRFLSERQEALDWLSQDPDFSDDE